MKFRIVFAGPDDQIPRVEPKRAEISESAPRRYDKEGDGMVRYDRTRGGETRTTRLANFTAQIVRDLVVDEDRDHRQFEIHAKLAGHAQRILISANAFQRMHWVLDRLGPGAIVYPGQQQHLRAAIQALSGSIVQERIFSHLGWRKLGGEWIYLHAGGAIDARGARSDLQVLIPAALCHYHPVVPVDANDRLAAIRGSIEFLSLAADRITIPLLAGVYRAALGGLDYSLFLVGQSGTFKSTLASLCQQHFGSAMDGSHLPANFASTANALEELAYAAKDALLTVDDFVPIQGAGDGALHALAERLFRAAGNRQGRNRLAGATRLDTGHPPRALMLATGEALPRGHSLQARLLTIHIRPGDVHRDRLSECQRNGHHGQLAMAMGAFLMWVANHYEEIQTRIAQRILEVRSTFQQHGLHPRIPSAMADLQAGWDIFLQFGLETGAINLAKQKELQSRSHIAFRELCRSQAREQADHHPLISSAASKKTDVVEMMKRPDGASVTEIMSRTNWQRHTVFGFVSNLKRNSKATVESRKTVRGERRYWII